MIQIYHNNRCSKSRCGLKILEESGLDFQVVKYLETPPSASELKHLITLLGIPPIDLVRKNEDIWKEKFKGKSLSDAAIIEALSNYPQLIERPIVISGNKAIIGRPPELILDVISAK